MIASFLRAATRLLAAALLCAAVPAAAKWMQAETDNFIVYSDGPEAELRGYARLLEDYDQLLRALTGAGQERPANKLRLYLVKNSSELRKVINGVGGIGGFYAASPDGIAAFAIRSGRDAREFGADDVILHEYAHHFMLQNFPANYPRWYVEGFAEYLATAEFTDTQIDLGKFNDVRASWLRARWYPLDQVLTGKEVGGSLFYAQSWLMVHYLMRDDDRRAKLQAYLRAYGEGKDPKASFREVFGMGAVDFSRKLANYGRDFSFTRIPRASDTKPPVIEVRALPAAADDLLLFDAGLRLGKGDWSGYPLLPRVRRAAEAHGGDPIAAKALIRAELLYGDRTRAQALLDKLLTNAPADRDALYLQGLLHILAGRADEVNRAAHFARARPWLARAHKVDENYYPALVRYAESFSADPEYASENVGNVLLLASQLAPQVGAIRLNAAYQQAVRGEFETAQALLAPLLGNEHDKKVAASAKALATQVKAGTRPQPTFYVE